MIDPITLASSFATIVGLIVAYKGERDKHSEQDYKDFIAWLSEKRHDGVIKALNQNNDLAEGITILLEKNHAQVMEKLNSLDLQLSHIATKYPDLSLIAKAIHKDADLSEQSQMIITQLVKSGAEYCMEHPVSTSDPDEFIFCNGANGNLQITEPRFLNEDLTQLERIGLIRVEYTLKNLRKLIPTRLAYKYYNS